LVHLHAFDWLVRLVGAYPGVETRTVLAVCGVDLHVVIGTQATAPVVAFMESFSNYGIWSAITVPFYNKKYIKMFTRIIL